MKKPKDWTYKDRLGLPRKKEPFKDRLWDIIDEMQGVYAFSEGNIPAESVRDWYNRLGALHGELL